MNDLDIIINGFNEQFIRFLGEAKMLCDRMGNDSVQAGDLIQLEISLQLKKDLMMNLALTHLIRYKNNIESNDFTFIEKFDIKSITNINLTIVKKYLSFIKLFKKLNPDNKRILFDYIRIFLDYSCKYDQLRQLQE
jgi:hypothetical protein